MSRVFFSVTMSLDGYMAPESRGDDAGDRRWIAQWMARTSVAISRAVHSPLVTHLFYEVRRKG